MRGKLITLEGIDGSGKSTVAKKFRKTLRFRYLTRYLPGSQPEVHLQELP